MMDHSRTRRSLLAAGVTIGSVGLAGCSSLTETDGTESPTQNASATPTSTPTGTGGVDAGGSTDDGGPVAALSIADPQADYPVLGSADATHTATLYGGWKCPYTREFVLQMLPDVIETYVAPEELAIEFRAVRFQADESWGDDEPRANRAGQAVWHEVPTQFPAYAQTLFANQPSEQTEWATVEQLIAFAEQAGTEGTEPIRESVTDGEYTAQWKQTMEVVSEKGIEGIPRFELGDEITAPILEPEATKQQLTTVLGGE